MAKWNYWNHILMWLLMYPMKKESENASEIERGESMKQLHARTRTHFNPSIFHVAFHMPNAHTFMDGCRFNELSPFFIRSLIEVALSRIAFSRIWLFYFLFIFFLFLFFGCGNCDLTENQKYVIILHRHQQHHHMLCVVPRTYSIYNWIHILI